MEAILCIQHLTGSVDHNIWITDGNDTFYGMDIIVSLTPVMRSWRVPEGKKFVTLRQISDPKLSTQ